MEGSEKFVEIRCLLAPHLCIWNGLNWSSFSYFNFFIYKENIIKKWEKSRYSKIEKVFLEKGLSLFQLEVLFDHFEVFQTFLNLLSVICSIHIIGIILL